MFINNIGVIAICLFITLIIVYLINSVISYYNSLKIISTIITNNDNSVSV